MTAQLDEGGGGILLGDNTGGGTVMLRPVRFRCIEPGSQLDCVVCIHVQLTVRVLCSELSRIGLGAGSSGT